MNRLSTLILSFLLIAFFSPVNAQLSYDFTTAGASGKDGPTQVQLNAEYGSTNLSGAVTSQSGIQRWIVPNSGAYSILAEGAQGGGAFGGFGASMQGEFTLVAGDTLYIIVGQEGGTTGNNHLAGGGASYVVQGSANNILLIAGGGGGAAISGIHTGGTVALNGQDADGAGQGLGGLNGQGGSGGSCRGGGGAGWFSAGGDGGCVSQNGQGGIPFLQGGQGGGLSGTAGEEGGFGGGGSTEGINTSWTYCGGGGGYSGGGGSSVSSTANSAGGGGSINNGINQVNTSAVQSGDGSVVISSLAPAPSNNAGVNSFVNPVMVSNIICAGPSSVDVIIQNYGGNQISSLNIDWTVNGAAQPTVSYTSLLDTFGGSGSSFDTVNLGTINISAATDLIAWTSLPNGNVDTVNNNDTAALSVDSVLNRVLDLGPDKINCTGNFVFLQDTSSQVFSSYLWSTGSTSPSVLESTSGLYSLTVTYGPPQCVAIDTIEIIDAPNPVVDLGADIENCGDTAIDAQNAGSTFSWSNGESTQVITLTQNGSYTVTVTTPDGCIGTDQINVIIHPLPTLDLGEDFEICIDKDEAATIGVTNTAGYTYEWNDGQVSSEIIVGTANSSTGNKTFWLALTDENGCSASDTVRILFEECLIGISSLDQNDHWKVYPSPADDLLFLELDQISPEVAIDLYDINGRHLRNLYSGTSNGRLQVSSDVADLAAGVYVVQFSSQGVISVKQIVIN